MRHDAESEGSILEVIAVLWCLVAMIVHVWTCVAVNWAAMLIIGLVFFPVGILHGSGIILGIW